MNVTSIHVTSSSLSRTSLPHRAPARLVSAALTAALVSIAGAASGEPAAPGDSPYGGELDATAPSAGQGAEAKASAGERETRSTGRTFGRARSSVEPSDPAAEADEPYPIEVRAIAELGALGVLTHTYQQGSNGTVFDYKKDGGQNVLAPTGRLSAELELNDAHTFIFLYQPLQLTTDVVFIKPVTIDELTFPAGTPMNLRYGFDYYRVSYLYDTWWDDPRTDLELGLSLQIRNAVVDFTSADGTLGRSFQNIGLVPALKIRARHNFDSGVWVAAEVDGMYAPVKYLNGGDSDVEGAIIDTSVRVGYKIAPSVSAFLNLREIGGGAEGTSKDEQDVGDGFNANWLAFLTGSVGVEWTPSELW
jgi:hypothetical protein